MAAGSRNFLLPELMIKSKNKQMKFVHYLEKITGVSIFPLMSLVIFGLFFIAVLLYVWKADKRTINDISRIPLD